MKPQQAPHIRVGQEGEEFVVKQLVKQKFKILDRNYRKKWGEIDIIAEKDSILHFVEVKTVSYETEFNNCQPEENINFFKKKRLARAIQTYLAEKHVSCETELRVDSAAVFYAPQIENCKMRFTENILLE